MSEQVDDELWSALGDPTRRRMLDLLVDSTARTPTALSHRLPVTRQAVAKHLDVLSRAGLVHVTRQGRESVYTLDEDRMAVAVAQLSEASSAWDRRLRSIKRMAEQLAAAARDDT